jgi:hypothetical protein
MRSQVFFSLSFFVFDAGAQTDSLSLKFPVHFIYSGRWGHRPLRSALASVTPASNKKN